MGEPGPGSGPAPTLLYDASRICTRVLNPTPNGIDRLDTMLARGLLGEGASRGQSSALVFGWGGPRLLPPATALAALDRAERVWREPEGSAGDADPLARLLPALTSSAGDGPRPLPRVWAGAPLGCRLGTALRAVASLGLRGGPDPARTAAKGAVYLNASHFPLDWASHVAWMGRRRDIRPVMLVHDLLPIDHPEWFWTGESGRHRTRLAALAERGAGAIVTSVAVEDRLRTEMARAGRRSLPVLRAAPPVAPLFRTPWLPDPRLASARFFVTCGTIEPRKNHALLLRLWRRLAAEFGRDTPKLVVVGKRGWRSDDVLAEMRDLAGAGHLVLAQGLPSGAYRTLLDGSLGLLAPSRAEGYGLPVAEALARGVPVVASDIPPFREQGADHLIDPADERAWYDALVALREAGPPTGRSVPARRPVEETDYLAEIRDFLDSLA